ncbi:MULTISPECIES: hypothetical protein [Metallosphaera]|uniref:Uncharacterized protein n=3 Tax=Metallosphaera TaxID=41980 RepID=A4YGC3_METS5|nr:MULTISPECIES: hypothetical protein [Metallosphaera]ABP95475.1 hypothetical protein Msed_1317 [Metallosphaera sedula DSM 5348]AIM27460.1 hypothetical protein HA72_1317 [Metallosphaera sedula]AKV74331.1 hypothetical protein MsedA_1335 [Metallosphaera sedula]AKV76570.1 hypothetical protein MsedB_1337 [Metallosphaera sedula]AKV78822.1 hypothetical protein MsedC_1335 [Metallosphaera sedula]
MDLNWNQIPEEVRFGIRYLSAHFYPKRYMSRWSILKPLSMKFVGNVRGYSPQQYQEELDHFEFFESYFRDDPLSEVELPSSYIDFFDELMKDFESGDIQRIVTRFHLVTEGILATTGLNVLRNAGERYGLTRFTQGIKHIIEDEARHINFGLSLVTDKTFALRRLNEIYPQAVKIVSDGRKHLEALTPFPDIVKMMEELRRAREVQLKI